MKFDGADQEFGVSSIQVLTKARRILDVFLRQPRVLTATEVQEQTGLPPSTSLRLLRSLVAEGFLDREGGGYRMGLQMLGWAAVARASLDVVAVGQAVLEDLRKASGESAYLYVRDGFQHVCVAVADSEHPVRQVLRVGQVLPLHAGSAGKVFLAFDRQASGGLNMGRLPALTENTITDIAELKATVENVRKVGYCASFEERVIGAASLSAPIFADSGVLEAVVGVAAPRQRFGPERVPELSTAVVQAADRMTGLLGGYARAQRRSNGNAPVFQAGH